MFNSIFRLICICFFICSLFSIDAKIVIPQARPYFMPEDHPIKAQLDAMFLNSRILLNKKTMREAGFELSGPGKFTRMITARNPRFPEYFFKLYLDAQHYDREFSILDSWALRAYCAENIQREIDKNGWGHLLKVPRKWIYQVPSKLLAPSEFVSKKFILVEDYMDAYSSSMNREMWKSDAVSYELLNAYYSVIKAVNLCDINPENTPFSKDGRVAFIDTESYQGHVNLKRMTPYLSQRNRDYWKCLIRGY